MVVGNVYNTLTKDASATLPLEGVEVVISRNPEFGWSSGGVELLPRTVTTDVDGLWTASLEANSALDGDYYIAKEKVPYKYGGTRTWKFRAYSGNHTLYSVLVGLPEPNWKNPLDGNIAFIGHSIIIGYNYEWANSIASGAGFGTPSKPTDQAWPTIACFSNEGLFLVRNAGVGGESSTQITARAEVDVFDYNPGSLVIQMCTNDPHKGVSVAQSVENMRTMVDACLAHSPLIQPIITTEIKKDFEIAQLAEINEGLRTLYAESYADNRNVFLCDLALDPPNTSATYLFDGTHTNNVGSESIEANGFSTFLSDLTIEASDLAYLCVEDSDPLNLVDNACFNSGAISAGAPPGWTATLSGTGTCPRTLTTPTSQEVTDGVIGNWLTFTPANINGSVVVDQALAITTEWVVGDWLAINVRCKWSGSHGDGRFTASLTFTGSGGVPAPIYKWRGETTPNSGIMTLLYQAPASSTACVVQLSYGGDGANTGHIVHFAQPTVINHGQTYPL